MSLVDWQKYTLWAREKDESFNRIFNYKDDEIVVFDLETTGTDAVTDEIIQISFMDGAGNVLLNSYVKPKKKRSWAEATKINGITPDMVKDAPSLADLKEQIQGILDKAKLLVGFNSTGFDMRFLSVGGVDTKKSTKHFDCMLEYSPVEMEWKGSSQDWKFQKLETAAAHYGYTYPAHDAGRDTQATLYVFKSMLADESRGSWRDYHQFIIWMRENGKTLTGFRTFSGWPAWVRMHEDFISEKIDGVHPGNGKIYYHDRDGNGGSDYSAEWNALSIDPGTKQASSRPATKKSNWKLIVGAVIFGLLTLSAFANMFTQGDFLIYLLMTLIFGTITFFLGLKGFGYKLSDLKKK